MSNNLPTKQRGGLALPSIKSMAHTYIGVHTAAVAAVFVAVPLALASSALTSSLFTSKTEASVLTAMEKTTRISKTDTQLTELKLGLISAHSVASNKSGTCHIELKGTHLFGKIIKATGTSTCLEDDGRHLRIKNHFVVADFTGGSFEYLPADKNLKPPTSETLPKIAVQEDLPFARAGIIPTPTR